MPPRHRGDPAASFQLNSSVRVQHGSPEDEVTLEEMVSSIDEILCTVDGTLEDSIRVSMGLQRIVAYFRAAELQQRRVDQWLYDPPRRREGPPRFPLDQGAALCEAHFLFICWDSIHKVVSNLRRNVYGFVTPRNVLRMHRSEFEHYRAARDHLEHLPERFPGGHRSDWRGDANRIGGTVAGVRRDGFFAFQREQWDITENSTALLGGIVFQTVAGLGEESEQRLADYRRGESAMRVAESH